MDVRKFYGCEKWEHRILSTNITNVLWPQEKKTEGKTDQAAENSQVSQNTPVKRISSKDSKPK